MRLYEIVLEPQTAFGTPLAGDTLFGQVCWQLCYRPELAAKPLPDLLALYPEQPFAVFSSAWPRFETEQGVVYALPRPALPRRLLPLPEPAATGGCRERLAKRPDKELKKKRWLLVGPELRVDLRRLAGEAELWELGLGQLPLDSYWYRELYKVEGEARRLVLTQPQPHNTINRLNQRTGRGNFAPYTLEVHFYCPTVKLALFVLVAPDLISIEGVLAAVRQIGRTGFGRDASTGLGRFVVVSHRELPLPQLAGGGALLTLGPSVPARDSYHRGYYLPLVRFGKHGDRLAVGGNPFKAPVVMAAPGAVFWPAAGLHQPWWGQAVQEVSKQEPKTVVQGYAPYLPLSLEVPNV